MSSISNLPLQEMIAGVVNRATEKLASQQDLPEKPETPETDEGDQEEEQSWTDPAFVEKLASACDFITGNIDGIETPNRGVLGDAMAKMAGVDMPPAVTTPEQLSVQASMPGTQKYKKDSPKGEDASASQASTPEGTAGLPGGATQMKNDMDSAPGPGSGSVPTATYPPAGPFHAGGKTAMVDLLKRAGSQVLQKEAMCGNCKMAGEKCACAKTAGMLGNAARFVDDAAQGLGRKVTEGVTRAGKGAATRMNPNTARAIGYGVPAAGVAGGAAGASALMGGGKKNKTAAEYGSEQKAEHQRIARGQGRVSGAMGALGGAMGGISSGGSIPGRIAGGLLGGAVGGGLGYGAGYGLSRGANRIARAAGGEGSKEKTAAEIARDKILRKLAGEDVMKAKISGDKGGGPLVGDGVMDAHQAEQVPSNATDGSGYGNPQRTHVQGNQAAIDYTKADAKKPQGKQMKEVLTEPAFNPSTDSKLREQLRNAGQAGVKIAEASASAIIKQAAAEGRITQETVNQFAQTGKVAMEGCECGGEGTCKVCKLKAAAEKNSMGDMPGGMGGGGAY